MKPNYFTNTGSGIEMLDDFACNRKKTKEGGDCNGG
jgi:hypothetical protein